jgi:hypothetical protein
MGTVRFFGHIVTGGLICSGPAASAVSNVIAFTAFAFQEAEISEGLEQGGILPNLGEVGLPHAPGLHIEVSAGLELPSMGDKYKRKSPETTAGPGIQPKGLRADFNSFRFGLLSEDTVVLRRARCLCFKGEASSQAVEFFQGLFIFLRSHFFTGHISGSTGRHEEKHVKRFGAQVLSKGHDLRKLVPVSPGEGCIDLHGDTGRFQIPDSFERGSKCSSHLAKCIVILGSWSVKADAHSRYTFF